MLSSEEKLKTSVFFIEATSFERFSLWKQYHEKIEWGDDTIGLWITVGHINRNKKMPVCVSFSFAEIFSKRICFYEPTSRFVDTDMVERWIKKRYPVKWDNGTRTAMTDANNFHHAVDRCENEP